MIEVEQKFVFTDATVHNLLEVGAALKDELEFTDEYYDTEDFRFTLGDCWLRQRNGKWQLKCPVSEKRHEDNCPVSVHREIDDVHEILKVLSSLLACNSSSVQLDDLVHFLNYYRCHVFAVIHTYRRSFHFECFAVDLDCTDDGFQVAEIEMMVDDQSHIPAAADKIREFATRIGFCIKKRIPGKMEMYLRQHHPEHYKVLAQLKILCVDQ